MTCRSPRSPPPPGNGAHGGGRGARRSVPRARRTGDIRRSGRDAARERGPGRSRKSEVGSRKWEEEDRSWSRESWPGRSFPDLLQELRQQRGLESGALQDHLRGDAPEPLLPPVGGWGDVHRLHGDGSAITVPGRLLEVADGVVHPVHPARPVVNESRIAVAEVLEVYLLD